MTARRQERHESAVTEYQARMLAADFGCEAKPYPLLRGRVEAEFPGGLLLIGTPDEIRNHASRTRAVACSEGGECDSQLSPDCDPPDYHCSKCGRYMGAA